MTGPAPSPTIRRATLADVPGIAEVHVRSWQWAYRGLLPDTYLDGMSVAWRAEQRATRLADEGETRTWVVERDGRIAGFATTWPSRDPDAAPSTAELNRLYLLREFAGAGLGRALLDHAIADLRRRGYERVTLWVFETNMAARRFYERQGWIADGSSKVEEFQGVVFPQVRYRLDRVSEAALDEPHGLSG